MTKFNHQTEHNRGQILLITVMLLATAITVVMTISFSSTTETQITKLEEESQKALSAAEAGLEAAIQKRGSVALSELSAFTDGDITGNATIVESGGVEFVTPLLQQDEQYMFYLTGYNGQEFDTNYWSGQLYIFAQSEGVDNRPALELTFVAADDTLEKYMLDQHHIIEGAENFISTTPTFISDSPGTNVDGVYFAYRSGDNAPQLTITGGKKLLIIRVINAPTRIGFKGSSVGIFTPQNLRSQGRKITSEAKTKSGVTKTIELFQSYPQIPSDFFVTTF